MGPLPQPGHTAPSASRSSCPHDVPTTAKPGAWPLLSHEHVGTLLCRFRALLGFPNEAEQGRGGGLLLLPCTTDVHPLRPRAVELRQEKTGPHSSCFLRILSKKFLSIGNCGTDTVGTSESTKQGVTLTKTGSFFLINPGLRGSRLIFPLGARHRGCQQISQTGSHAHGPSFSVLHCALVAALCQKNIRQWGQRVCQKGKKGLVGAGRHLVSSHLETVKSL